MALGGAPGAGVRLQEVSVLLVCRDTPISG